MLREKIIEKLKEMESDGHIVRVEDPTEWVSSMVVSVRKDKVRICIDSLPPPRLKQSYQTGAPPYEDNRGGSKQYARRKGLLRLRREVGIPANQARS